MIPFRTHRVYIIPDPTGSLLIPFTYFTIKIFFNLIPSDRSVSIIIRDIRRLIFFPPIPSGFQSDSERYKMIAVIFFNHFHHTASGTMFLHKRNNTGYVSIILRIIEYLYNFINTVIDFFSNLFILQPAYMHSVVILISVKDLSCYFRIIPGYPIF